MDNEIFESIIKITKKQDSDEFSISIVTTLAEIIPNSVVAFFKYCPYAVVPYRCISTLMVEKTHDTQLDYHWDARLPASSWQYIQENYQLLTRLSEYQTQDDRYHVFIPIDIEAKIAYGIEISAMHSFKDKLEVLIAITKVCQNFYAILAFSEKDTLTGLYNRRTYDNKLSTLLKNQKHMQLHNLDLESQQESRVLSADASTWIAIFDIDFFKKVNDKFGHIYGDEVLLLLAQLMQQSFRKNDLLFRFGGEEFVLVLEPISFEQAKQVLDKFRSSVAQHVFPMVGRITVSCGFAKIAPNDHAKAIFDNADKALYYAKEHGRNRVCSYEVLLKQQLIQPEVAEGDIELF